MSWDNARRYRQLLTRACEHLDATGVVPWSQEWADEFASPYTLRLALLTRWRTMVEAQDGDVPLADLAARHPGLAALAGVRTAELLVAS